MYVCESFYLYIEGLHANQLYLSLLKIVIKLGFKYQCLEIRKSVEYKIGIDSISENRVI